MPWYTSIHRRIQEVIHSCCSLLITHSTVRSPITPNSWPRREFFAFLWGWRENWRPEEGTGVYSVGWGWEGERVWGCEGVRVKVREWERTEQWGKHESKWGRKRKIYKRTGNTNHTKLSVICRSIIWMREMICIEGRSPRCLTIRSAWWSPRLVHPVRSKGCLAASPFTLQPLGVRVVVCVRCPLSAVCSRTAFSAHVSVAHNRCFLFPWPSVMYWAFGQISMTVTIQCYKI